MVLQQVLCAEEHKLRGAELRRLRNKEARKANKKRRKEANTGWQLPRPFLERSDPLLPAEEIEVVVRDMALADVDRLQKTIAAIKSAEGMLEYLKSQGIQPYKWDGM
jgi:hypothetical protein